MVVLIIAFVALICFLGILTQMGNAQLVQAGRVWRRQRRKPGRLLAGLTFDQAFDENYSVIWQTQAPALRLIDSAGDLGLLVSGLRPWFRGAARKYPALYDGFSFDDWVRFLHQSQLIDLTAGRVRLTPEGRGFLDYSGVAH